MGGVKYKILYLLKTNIIKNYSKPTHVNNAYGGGKKPRKPKMKRQFKDSIIKNVRNFFEIEAIKERTTRYIKNLFEQQGDY